MTAAPSHLSSGTEPASLSPEGNCEFYRLVEEVGSGRMTLPDLMRLAARRAASPQIAGEVREALEPFLAVAKVMDFYTEESMPVMVFPRPECESRYPDEPRCATLTTGDFARLAAHSPQAQAGEPTTAQIDAALHAWFKSPPSETDQGLERSMKAALIAAGISGVAQQPIDSGAILENCDKLHDLGFVAGWNGAVEECANIASAIDSGRGNEKQIAEAIRALAVPSTSRATGPLVPWELKCRREVCAAPECDCPAVTSTPSGSAAK